MKFKLKYIFYLLIGTFLFTNNHISAQNEIKFDDLNSIMKYAETHSSVLHAGEEQSRLANLTKLTAIADVVNFRNSVNFTLTNNSKLPVNFIPSELIGGSPGTFKEITLGQQYVSNFNFSPQIDLVNPGAWANIKKAAVNEDITDVNNKINKKNLFESIAACYYNIISLNDQIEIARQNSNAADTILTILKNKYSEGITRQQDVNDAEINKITLEDKVNQMKISLNQQFNNLKTLCDVPDSINILIKNKIEYNYSVPEPQEVSSNLLYRSSLLQSELAKADIGYNFWAQFPTISLVYSNTYSQNSNAGFFDTGSNAGWLNSIYIGLKATFNLPDVNKILMTKNADLNYEISRINLEHEKLQNKQENNQLELDFEKAISQYSMAQKTLELKKDNYNHALAQYNQSILPADKLLTAFADVYNSKLNLNNALSNLQFLQEKIEINNRIK